MLFPGRIYIAQGPWHLGDLCNIFLPNINKDQKKVLLSEGRALALSRYGKYGAGYCFELIKSLNKGLR